MNTDPPPVLIEARTVHQGFSTFVITRVRLPDGTEVKREVEDHGDAVAILPYDPKRRTALLVRGFRAPALYRGAPSLLVEAAAGLIDPGETADTAARREAEEETGGVIETLESLGTVWTSPGVSTERLGFYLAACDFEHRGPGGGKAGENEDLTVLEIPLAELAAQADRGEIEDIKLFALLQTLRLRLPDLF